MVKSRKMRGRGRTRRRRAGTKSKRGGNLLGSVVGALKTALPSIVLYEALRAQGKRVRRGGKKTRRGGRRRRRGGRRRGGRRR